MVFGQYIYRRGNRGERSREKKKGIKKRERKKERGDSSEIEGCVT